MLAAAEEGGGVSAVSWFKRYCSIISRLPLELIFYGSSCIFKILKTSVVFLVHYIYI